MSGESRDDVRLVELDGRHRVSLSSVTNRSRRYILHESPDGTITLEPAVVLTALERAYLDNPEVRAAVEHGRANPQDRRAWVSRKTVR